MNNARVIIICSFLMFTSILRAEDQPVGGDSIRNLYRSMYVHSKRTPYYVKDGANLFDNISYSEIEARLQKTYETTGIVIKLETFSYRRGTYNSATSEEMQIYIS